MRRTKKASLAISLCLSLVVVLRFGSGTADTISFTNYRVGLGGFEPAINISPEGRIFVDAPNGFPTGHGSMAWTDNLAGCSATSSSCFKTTTYADSTLSRYPGSGDTEVAVGSIDPTTGKRRVYLLDLWVGSNTFLRSNDNGETWSEGTAISNAPTSDRQWMAVGPVNANGEDTIYILSQQFTPPNWAMMSRSDDGGRNWDVHKVVPAPQASRGFTGPIIADQTGYVGFIWIDGQDVKYAFSTDKGDTWTQAYVGYNGWDSVMPSVAKVGERLYASWIDQQTYQVMMAISTDSGATWQERGTLISNSGSNVFAWLDARGDKVAIAWYNNASSVGDPNNATGNWRVKYSESTDAGLTWSPPVDASGNVKNGRICTTGVTCTSGRELGDFLNIAIDAAGKSVISYFSISSTPRNVGIAKQN